MIEAVDPGDLEIGDEVLVEEDGKTIIRGIVQDVDVEAGRYGVEIEDGRPDGRDRRVRCWEETGRVWFRFGVNSEAVDDRLDDLEAAGRDVQDRRADR